MGVPPGPGLKHVCIHSQCLQPKAGFSGATKAALLLAGEAQRFTTEKEGITGQHLHRGIPDWTLLVRTLLSPNDRDSPLLSCPYHRNPEPGSWGSRSSRAELTSEEQTAWLGGGVAHSTGTPKGKHRHSYPTLTLDTYSSITASLHQHTH